MRFIYLIFCCILFYSCSPTEVETKLIISNNYLFIRECISNPFIVTLPCDCVIESKEYGGHFDKYNLRHDSLVIAVQFGTNSSEKNIIESLLSLIHI